MRANDNKHALNKCVLEKCGVDIRSKILYIKACGVMDSVPSEAVSADIPTFKLNKFINRNKLLQPQSSRAGNSTVFSSPVFLCFCAHIKLLL